MILRSSSKKEEPKGKGFLIGNTQGATSSFLNSMIVYGCIAAEDIHLTSRYPIFVAKLLKVISELDFEFANPMAKSIHH